MPVSMYTISVPIFIQFIGGLSDCLKKAAAHATERNIDIDFILNMRLSLDMWPYKRQLQQATLLPSLAVAALTGTQPRSMPNNENDVGALTQRLATTTTYLSEFRSEQIDGTEDKSVTIALGGRDRSFSGQELLLNFVLPNFYFHCATAYDLLRHCGVTLAKRDFMGTPVR
jgi:uncharacterized protein